MEQTKSNFFEKSLIKKPALRAGMQTKKWNK